MSLFIHDFSNCAQCQWTPLVTCLNGQWSWWQRVWFDSSPCFTDSRKSFWCSRRCHSDSKLFVSPHPLWLQPSHIIMTLCFTLDSLTYCTFTHLSILKPSWSQLSCTHPSMTPSFTSQLWLTSSLFFPLFFFFLPFSFFNIFAVPFWRVQVSFWLISD